MTILVVCGLRREAAIAQGAGVATVAGGGDRRALEGRLAALDRTPFEAVVSFGLAGALADDLEPGTTLVPQAVLGDDARRYPADRSLVSHWRAACGARSLPWSDGDIVGSDVPVLTKAAKHDLGRSGASAVDMESHVAAAYASRRVLPFAALRVISDPAGRDLPPLAGSAMRPDGSVDVAGVVAGLARDPRQLPALLRTARDAKTAFGALRRVGDLLRLGLPPAGPSSHPASVANDSHLLTGRRGETID